MPRRVKKRRQLTTDTGADAGWEEYWDYIFPEDEVRSSSSFSNHSFFSGGETEHESAQNGERVEEKERFGLRLGFRFRLILFSAIVPNFTATQFFLQDYEKIIL